MLRTVFGPVPVARDWSKHVTWLNMPQAKTGLYPGDIAQFLNRTCCEKYLTDNKHNSLHLALKICSNTCRRTSSVPRNEHAIFWKRSLQFPSTFALGKLFASRNRICPRNHIRTYFHTKRRLLFIVVDYLALRRLIYTLRFIRPTFCIIWFAWMPNL